MQDKRGCIGNKAGFNLHISISPLSRLSVWPHALIGLMRAGSHWWVISNAMRPLTIFYAGLVAQMLQTASSQKFRRKFDFLPVSSEAIWGSHLRGPANTSYNEWNAEAPLCEEIYSQYLDAVEDLNPKIGDYIYNTSECILNSCSLFQTQTIQPSSVLLGLAPILLSTTGPTLTEVAFISIQRPSLAVLLSLGTAAVYPTRTLSSYDDRPRDVLARHRLSSHRILSRLLHRRPLADGGSRLTHALFGTLEYIIAAGAACNSLYTSWQLGSSTIFVLDCTQSWFPLFWSFLPLVVHTLVCGSFHHHHRTLMRHKRSESSRRQGSEGQRENSHEQTGSAVPLSNIQAGSKNIQASQEIDESRQLRAPRHESQSSSRALERVRSSENEQDAVGIHGWKTSKFEMHLVPACAQPKIAAKFLDSPSLVVDMAHKLGTMLAFAQVIVGVIGFSSLLFISAGDAAAMLLRYLASVVVCRVLMAVELEAIRTENVSSD